MLVTPIRTDTIRPNQCSLSELVDTYISELSERSIVVFASKVVSLCEGRVVPIDGTDREALIAKEADLYLPSSYSSYNHHFGIKRGTIVGAAGIDVSNGDGNYVLWPQDPQQTANDIRAYLRQKFSLEEVGVLITDSTSYPLRIGALGVVLAHSGFLTIRNYIGEKDLFDHEYIVERANIGAGLAAAAVVAMGEGSESMPLCVLSDIPFVTFQAEDPTQEELESITLNIENDLFEPFLRTAPWQSGQSSE